MDVRLAKPEDREVLLSAGDAVFDFPPRAEWVDEFLSDPRHHLVIALEGETLAGFASAVHYLHPDKDPELWINEVGVDPLFQGKGLGKRLMATLLEHGRTLGCREAWVVTETDNGPANGLYRASGGRPEAATMFTFSLSDPA